MNINIRSLELQLHYEEMPQQKYIYQIDIDRGGISIWYRCKNVTRLLRYYSDLESASYSMNSSHIRVLLYRYPD